MLHVIKTDTALKQVTPYYSAQDVLLLIEDAVYAANPLHYAFEWLAGKTVFVLEADVKARGIYHRVSPLATIIDYLGFVELTEQHHTTMTWE
ncbi:sulfurtransferase complex subunit TusB [Vibrio rhizosphaerae]|uniref:Sulfurtransferase complex subunit TusB n=1 Tax=Vibrio rhizosphaerae TaxID=398736 RepID=A0ABU4INX8_9VIBR|nr:sulfurtransferase complex subunit TusB [Vibrio rhizosphaerae]MDW6091115.1 sulfurtransferase complex subunit TusB [Vibrio rhizosphaerae]